MEHIQAISYILFAFFPLIRKILCLCTIKLMFFWGAKSREKPSIGSLGLSGFKTYMSLFQSVSLENEYNCVEV